MRRWPIFFALLASAGPAWAGDAPLYGPVPGWVVPAPAIATNRLNDASPQVLVFDNQQRLEGNSVTVYFDVANRATTTQALNEMGTLMLPWSPDKGDLTIHRVEILRGAETIDVLKSGDRFTVLRREEGMERMMLTGQLTATMAVKGLQLGDTLRVAFSMTMNEPVLKGHGQTVGMTPASPFRTQFGRLRLLWPTGRKVAWKGYSDGIKPVFAKVGGDDEMTIPLPLAKQPEAPGNLPDRYAKPPIVEVSSFADWPEVSRTLAPLYATDGLIAPGSPLAAEVTKLKAVADPLARTERALELVQDKIRYLAVAMDGGNLTPQTPAKTWELRYGDCKAKTLLLLALLHGAGIEAEAVTVSMQTRGFVAARLPGPAAFDHVLVRASVNGRSLWLDGTGAGARLADIGDVPGYGQVLPLRAAGAALMPVAYAADQRPRRNVAIMLDQSAGVDFPALWRATVTIRGAAAQGLNAAVGQADARQKAALIQSVVSGELGDVQMSSHAIAYDPDTATATVTAAGLGTTRWQRDDRRWRQSLDRAIGSIAFAPDRSRAAWRDIPVATGVPDSALIRTVVKLPAGVTGYTLEGDQTLTGTIAGRRLSRTTAMAGDTVTIEDRVDLIEPEIAPAAIAAERAKLAAAQGRLLRIVAPATLPSRVETVRTGRKAGRFTPIETAFAQAIAAAADDPEDMSGYVSRASFRAGIYDYAGAIADVSKAIATQETAELLGRRAWYHAALGARAKAVADYAAAYGLDPSQEFALIQQADLMAMDGDSAGALKLLDARIDTGGEERFKAIAEKAFIQRNAGDPVAAIATIDAAVVEKPADPYLLNMRCWVKGTGNQALDSALADCTRAIELGNGAGALDSRSLVFFRLGRLAEALVDVDAALAVWPTSPGSLFLRGIIKAKMGKAAAAAIDLGDARLIQPSIDAEFKRYGITA